MAVPLSQPDQTRKRFWSPLRIGCAGALLVFALLFALFADAVANAPYLGEVSTCRSNLEVAGGAIHIYRASHHGQLPPSLSPIIAMTKSWLALSCPVNGSHYDSADNKEVIRSYAYQFAGHPGDNEIILWDSAPHHPRHPLLRFLNRDSRNVLYLNGTVKSLPEEEFQRLKLQGTTVDLSRLSH